MALAKARANEIPSDAVVLREDQALMYQMKIMKSWKDRSDVFFFNSGCYILGGVSFLTGVFVNNHFRTKLRLYHYGRMSSYLPICVIPGVISTFTHVQFVLQDVLLQKNGDCPVCLQLRGSALQAFIGCALPTILAPISSLGLAHRFATFDVPYITQEPMKVWKLIQKTYKPISNALFGIFLAQALLGSAITYLEAKSVHTVSQKLSLLEQDMENR